MTTEELLHTAVAASKEGARILDRYFGDADLEVGFKGVNDLVTQADRESEEAIIGEIRRRFPRHSFLGEEGGSREGEGEIQWIIDPLDGTANFTQGLPYFCISIACRRGDELLAGVVYDPLRDDLFTAARGAGARRGGRPIRVSDRPGLEGAFLATGYPYLAHPALDVYLAAFREVFLRVKSVRRCGAAALDLAFTAAGTFDGFFEFRLSPWDIAAGALLLQEAGGVVTDLDGGGGFLEGGSVVAGAPGVQRDLQAAVARHVDEATLERLLSRADEGVSASDVPLGAAL